jgi:predicted nucleic acid-binding protein
MYLLDTDTVIYSLKGQPQVVAALGEHRDSPMAISVITLGELLHGARRSTRQARNLAQVRRLGEAMPVIDVSRAVIETFAELKSGLARKGRPLDDFDLIIAATALMLGATLVTNNTKHFARIAGLPLESWVDGAG